MWVRTSRVSLLGSCCWGVVLAHRKANGSVSLLMSLERDMDGGVMMCWMDFALVHTVFVLWSGRDRGAHGLGIFVNLSRDRPRAVDQFLCEMMHNLGKDQPVWQIKFTHGHSILPQTL